MKTQSDLHLYPPEESSRMVQKTRHEPLTNKAMKDILVSYTRQEKDEATGNYISVNHKGYIQHWDCCPTYTMAIIPSIEGKFHSVSIDKIWVEKEDMPQNKNNPEINRRNHKGVNTNRKGTNLNI